MAKPAACIKQVGRRQSREDVAIATMHDYDRERTYRVDEKTSRGLSASASPLEYEFDAGDDKRPSEDDSQRRLGDADGNTSTEDDAGQRADQQRAKKMPVRRA